MHLPVHKYDVAVPTYQYVCGACGEPHEAVQSFADASLTTCPSCHAEALKKVFGSVGVVFKGSGFYRNDARAGGASAPAAPASPAPSSDTSSSAS